MFNRETHLRVLVLFATLVFVASSVVNADTLAFQTYTQHDGLASNYITSIAFASDGTAWIGTTRGATRIQDKYWFAYTDANGLSNSWVNAITITPARRVYFATNGGLDLFDGATRRTYTAPAIPSNYLTVVTLDKQNRVWVGTDGYGIARLDGETWSKFSLANNYINAIAFDANNNTWVATNRGAFFFDGEAWTPTTGVTNTHVSSIAIAPDRRIWFGTDDGVIVYDGKTHRAYTKTDGLADNRVRAIAIDATRVWVGTARGLSVLQAGQWKTYTRADGLADDQINALAIDAQKNLWVGTARGLSIFGNVTLARAYTVPVVLVHGWHTADSDEFNDTEFRYIRQYLEADGIPVFYAQGISPYKTLLQNAATLRDVIADIKSKTGAPQVDVIAFSMGGLNTRAYLESTLYQNDVRRAIILGTPQAGVQMWYPLLTREIQDRPDEPSVIELTPEYAALFNRTHQPRTTIPYDLLIGDAREQAGLDLLKIFPANDGLIDVWSAHILMGPQVRRITNQDVHGWDPSPLIFDLTSYLYPRKTYEQYLRNALRDPDARPIGLGAAPVEPIQPRNITPLNVDTLRASITLTRTILIDENRAARFIARWSDGDVALALRAPDGTLYASDTVSNSISSNETYVPRVGKKDLLDATYLKAGNGNFIGYSIPRAQVGMWSLVATRLDQAKTPITLTLYADLDADIKLDVKTDRAWYRPGMPVVLEATLSNHDANADVRAQIEWLGNGKSLRGAPIQSVMLQEGAPGFYADAFTNLTRGGYYLARVTARGANYARERQIIFSISPQTASFVADVMTHATRNALNIEAAVNVTRAGEFAIGAILRGPRGQLIAALTAPFTLNAGTQNIALAIPGREIRARGIDGPYTLELVLMDASWAAVQVDELPKPIITAPYRANDFAE